ncbi:MAG: efflux RND transporter permease subunit [Rhodocyclaceae bacterium]|nr:efflux RND transporter permease subunit [Rhodocyclaceae bacterium]
MSLITEFALRNSRLTILAVLFFVLGGVLTFLNYPSREDPSIVIRQAQVSARFPGMATLRVEQLITRKLEEKIREIPEVKHIVSDSKTGVSLISITLRDDVVALGPVWQDLRDKMSDVAGSLPAGTIGPSVNDQVGLTAVATIALWADGFDMAELSERADHIREALYALPGVMKIDAYGGQDERVFMEFSRERLAQLGIDPDAVVNTLKTQNIILPGGSVDASGQVFVLEPSGNFESVAEIRDTLITIPGGSQVLRLGDIMTLRRGFVDPPQSKVYFDGHPALVLGVSALDGTNAVAFGEQLRARLGALQDDLPLGYVLEFATYQPELIEATIAGATTNLFQTLVIVLAVVMLFLGVRTGLIVGAFVPVTMLLAIIVMRWFDVELQRVSIAALIIALGMLVDNGIVIAEDIRVRLEAGTERLVAAMAAGKTLAIPLLTSSLTTILFFMPMALAEGGTGEFTRSLAQVVTIVLLASWFLSLFMTPAFCVWFMKVTPTTKPASARFDAPSYRLYRRVLEGILRLRWLFLAAMFALLAVAVAAMNLVGKEFFPLGDRNQYLVYVDLPAGSSIHKTDEVVRRLADWLADRQVNPEIVSSVAYVATGGPRFFLSLASMDPDPHRAFVVVNTAAPDQVDGVVARTRAFALEQLPEARVSAKKMWMGASESGLLELRLIGPNGEALRGGAESLLAALRGVDGMTSVKQDWENRVAKIRIDVDQSRARAAGVTSQDIANALNMVLSGTTVTDYREGDDVIPVIMRSEPQARGALSELQALSVYSRQHGTWIPLPQVARIGGEWTDARIRRRDQARTLTISAKHGTLSAAELLPKVQDAIDRLELPPGHRLEIGGEIESQAEANEKLFAALPMCLALIAVLLVGQFNSFRRPLIILATIPLVLIGAVTGLLALDALFGFMVMLGLFSLAGIIINNGIVLIERIGEEECAGKPPHQAIVDACLARLRPILITSLTTILGLLPLILSRDPLFYAMACAMAFGLAVGTLLTLGFVPALYAVMYRVRPSPRGGRDPAEAAP